MLVGSPVFSIQKARLLFKTQQRKQICHVKVGHDTWQAFVAKVLFVRNIDAICVLNVVPFHLGRSICIGRQP